MKEKKQANSNKLIRNRAVVALLLVCLIMSMMPNAMAKRKTSGTFEGTEWNYNIKTKTLTLSCKGKMDDILVRYYGDTWPWEEWAYKDDEFDVEKLVIKEGVTYVGYYVTSLMLNLKSISLPKSLKRIGYGAFAFSDITKLALPPNLKTIDGKAFYDTKLKELVIPEGVTQIGKKAFASCKKLTKVQLPAKLNKISDGLLWKCTSLKTITIPDKVTQIGKEAFSESGLIGVTIPRKVTDINRSAFLDCTSLKKVTFQTKKLKVIDVSLFEGCKKLKSVTLPNSITEIKKQAFKKSGLTAITIPEKVTTIGKEAFSGCKGLKEVVFSGNKITSIGSKAFLNIPKDCVFKVPVGQAETMKTMLSASGLGETVVVEEY